MNTFIAFLRGINVGGKNNVKMADLKELFTNLEFENIKTYIQSGNIIFDSDKNEEALIKLLENEISTLSGTFVHVILRTKEELNELVKNNPFSDSEISKVKNNSPNEVFYIMLFGNKLSDKESELLKSLENGSEKFFISGRNIYLLVKNTIRESRLSMGIQKLKMEPTTRNWKTINKILELL